MIGLILAAAAALSQGGSGEPSPKKPDERRICRVVEDTGSRMSRRRDCRTAGEWELARREAERFATERQGGNLSVPESGGVSAPQ